MRLFDDSSCRLFLAALATPNGEWLKMCLSILLVIAAHKNKFGFLPNYPISSGQFSPRYPSEVVFLALVTFQIWHTSSFMDSPISFTHAITVSVIARLGTLSGFDNCQLLTLPIGIQNTYCFKSLVLFSNLSSPHTYEKIHFLVERN